MTPKPNKTYLMTPGPCPVHPDAALALARHVIHHRSEEYHALHASVTKGLREIVGTAGEILLFASTGTGAMESAVVNTLSPGDRALVLRCGKFSARWGEICAAHGAEAISVDAPWGEAVPPDAVSRALDAHPGAAAVFATLCETSTGVKTDIEAIAARVRPTPAAFVVDAVSGLASSAFRMDDWGVDVAVSAGQKGLMIPTGLGVAAVGEGKGGALAARSRMPRYYFDWTAALAAARKNETAWSAPGSLVAALKISLDLILAEGLDRVLERHARMGRACRAGVSALGLRLLAPSSPADGLTAAYPPPGIAADDLRRRLREGYGITVAGGQGELKGRIIRVAHMGWAGPFDVLTAVAGIEMALADLGAPAEPGKGVAATEAAFRG